MKEAALSLIANALADGIICSCGHAHAKARVNNAYFAKRDRRLKPYDRAMRAALRSVWADELRIMLANLRRLGKGLKFSSSILDLILYPKSKLTAAMATSLRAVLASELEAMGQHALDDIKLDIAFDVDNPRIQDWLDTYSLKLSKNLEDVNEQMIREQLIDGINAGEGIPELTARVHDLFDSWDRARAEMIARTETIRASNQAALEAYHESGVVHFKTWLPAPDACDICVEIGLKDPIPLDEPFFDDDYGDGQAPPAHVNCRCACAAIIED
jgi:SPP1 gp7 family putative phage head morphogenesis protein